MTNHKTNMKFTRKGTLSEGFTWILNKTLNDKELTSCPEAVVVFLKISQYENSPTHKINIRGLATQTGLTVGKVSKGFKKLMELGYIERIPIYNGNLINGYEYFIYDIREENVNYRQNLRNENPSINSTKNDGKTVGNSRGIENGNIGGWDTENTYIKKKIEKKENKKKENKGVDGDSTKNSEPNSKENMIIELYKTYKIQSRVMPQMKKLLLTYSDKIDLELYEEIFMLASEDNVKSKYNYIRDLLEKFDTKGIYTLKDYQLDCDEFKKANKVNGNQGKSKCYKGQNKRLDSKQVNTRFHDVDSKLKNMPVNEVEETLAINDYVKHNNKREIHKIYLKAMNLGLSSLATDDIRKSIINYAIFENLEVPK